MQTLNIRSDSGLQPGLAAMALKLFGLPGTEISQCKLMQPAPSPLGDNIV